MSWYYAKHGKQEGPVDLEALRSLVASGQVSPGDLVWQEGMEAWKPMGEVSELSPAPPAESAGEPPPGGSLGAGPGVASPPPHQPAPQHSGGGAPIAPGAPQPGAPLIAAPAPTSGLAIASLVCGLVSLVLCYIWALAGIPAVICGHMALKKIRNAEHRIEGRGMAIAGLVTGYISNAMQLLTILGVIWLIIVGANP